MAHEPMPFRWGGRPAVPTTGLVACGTRVVLAWPEPAEYDAITELRNRPSTRPFFLDERPIDVVANRHWLETGMPRGQEGLLVIRWGASGDFVGTIGWTDWNPQRRTACFGRLMVDRRGLARLRTQRQSDYPGVATDAALTLRDWAFEVMRLVDMTTWYLEGNMLAARVNATVGMVAYGRQTRTRSDGTSVVTIELRLSRRRWLRLRNPR